MSDMLFELRMQSLLKGLNDSEIERFIPFITNLQFPKDAPIFREGQPSRGIYMIKYGRIEISKTTADGWRQPLLFLDRGHFLGEIALLEKTGHGSDATALSPSELFLIPKESFEEMEKKEPLIMLKVIKNIAIIAGLNIRRMNHKFLNLLINY
ncbi:MAG: Crp/Fnr family transcriptional regulator [Nitrospirota bacterium]